MREYYPLLLTGGIIGLITIIFVTAYALIKNKKEEMPIARLRSANGDAATENRAAEQSAERKTENSNY